MSTANQTKICRLRQTFIFLLSHHFGSGIYSVTSACGGFACRCRSSVLGPGCISRSSPGLAGRFHRCIKIRPGFLNRGCGRCQSCLSICLLQGRCSCAVCGTYRLIVCSYSRINGALSGINRSSHTSDFSRYAGRCCGSCSLSGKCGG